MIVGYRRSALFVGALALAASACSSDVTSPSKLSPSRSGRSSVGTNQGSPFHPNSVKYSDAASHPATGRSGSASIIARALLAKNGTTLIEASTGGALDVTTPPPGTITKVQLKSINAAGDALRTVNFNGLSAGGYWSTTTSQLGHNAPIQIQTNVGGIDGKRNDVVTVKAVVKKRPDLTVTSVTNPATAAPNTDVSISALVSEINGDVGATANCLLFIDGTQADQVLGMWVDGGSAVSCAFTHNFPTAGTYALEVRATNVVPADWDLANNSATGSIKIVDPIVNMWWNASASHYDQGNSFNGSEYYNDCYYYYYYCSGSSGVVGWNNSYSNSQAYFNAQGSSQSGGQWPMDVNFSGTTDGGALMQMHGQAGYAGMSGCWYMYDNATSTQGNVCQYGNTTYANFQRYAGKSTYYSYQSGVNWSQNPVYCYYYDQYGYYYYYVCGYNYYESPYSWSSNYEYTNGSGPQFNVGSQVSVDLTMTDANGQKFVAGGSFPVNTYYNPYDYSYYACDYNYYYYYNYQRCGTYHQWYNQRYGYGSGYGKAE